MTYTLAWAYIITAFTAYTEPSQSREGTCVHCRCGRMEQAVVLLSEAGKPLLAPALAVAMRSAIGDFRPACVLDQLKVRPHPEPFDGGSPCRLPPAA